MTDNGPFTSSIYRLCLPDSRSRPFCKHSWMNTKMVIRSCYIKHATYKEIRNGYIISDTSIVMSQHNHKLSIFCSQIAWLMVLNTKSVSNDNNFVSSMSKTFHLNIKIKNSRRCQTTWYDYKWVKDIRLIIPSMFPDLFFVVVWILRDKNTTTCTRLNSLEFCRFSRNIRRVLNRFREKPKNVERLFTALIGDRLQRNKNANETKVKLHQIPKHKCSNFFTALYQGRQHWFIGSTNTWEKLELFPLVPVHRPTTLSIIEMCHSQSYYYSNNIFW